LKIFISLLIAVSIMFASDATIEVVKKADSLPSLAVEDSSISYDQTFKERFFKSIVADLNVLSIFNVDRNYRTVSYDASNVVVENKDMNYVLRYKLSEGENRALNVELKIFTQNNVVFNKIYKLNNPEIYMFASHEIAYDVNSFMGEAPIEWIKRKVKSRWIKNMLRPV